MKIYRLFTATVTTNAVLYFALNICAVTLSVLNLTERKVSYQCTVQYDSLHTQIVTIRDAKRMPKISLDGRTGSYVKCIQIK